MCAYLHCTMTCHMLPQVSLGILFNEYNEYIWNILKSLEIISTFFLGTFCNSCKFGRAIRAQFSGPSWSGDSADKRKERPKWQPIELYGIAPFRENTWLPKWNSGLFFWESFVSIGSCGNRKGGVCGCCQCLLKNSQWFVEDPSHKRPCQKIH